MPQPDGGYLLTGHWQFGTGICHADWVLLSGRIEGDEPPAPRNFLVPVDEVEVKDTWHVDGMAATGSRDIVATDVVRARAPRLARRSRPRSPPGPMRPTSHRIPISPMLSLTAALPAVGAAQRALELFEALLFERIQFGTTRTQSNRVPTQVRLANLVVEVDAAETLHPRRRPPHAGPRRRRGHVSTCSSSSSCGWRSPTSCGAAATSCATSSRRAARRCTTSTTSCSASTATST